jgi:hypothetical protein
MYSLIAVAALTVKGKGLLETEFTCTITFPLELPAGTSAAIDVLLHDRTVAATPLKLTVLPP